MNSLCWGCPIAQWIQGLKMYPEPDSSPPMMPRSFWGTANECESQSLWTSGSLASLGEASSGTFPHYRHSLSCRQGLVPWINIHSSLQQTRMKLFPQSRQGAITDPWQQENSGDRLMRRLLHPELGIMDRPQSNCSYWFGSIHLMARKFHISMIPTKLAPCSTYTIPRCPN